MPVLADDISEHGAIVEIIVGVPDAKRAALLRVGFKVPERQRVRCMIDTGANISGITADVMEALDLTPIGRTKVFTPSTGKTPHECNEHAVSLSLVHDGDGIEMYVGIVSVIESEMWQEESAKGLIGRDILDLCLFVYDGPHGRYSLGF